MERPTTSFAEGSTDWSLPTWAWLLGVTALLAWHAWLTLALFGAYPWTKLDNDEAILSGVHPQHLYLGAVGARAMAQHGRTTVIDHRFQAGYPKTPIFDGARMAELWLLLGGGSYQPAAYKIGLAGLCMLVPLFLLVTCKTLGLGSVTALLATFLGQLIWWGPHGQGALVTGDCGLYLASLSALAHIGFLISFHRTASVRAWIGLWVTGSVSWFLQPLYFPIALPVLLTYYLSVGVKHDFLTWHVAFWSVEGLAFLVNLPWMSEWLDSWWLRTPLPIATDLLEHRTFVTVWNAPLWGGSMSKALAILLTMGGAAGIIILNQTRHRPAARMLGLSATGALVLALLGIAWEPLGAVGTAVLLAPAMWIACVPAAHACVWLSGRLWKGGSVGRSILAAVLIALPAAFIYLIGSPAALAERLVPGEALEIGVSPERQAIVDTLLQYTSDDARILWEDRTHPRQKSRWPALLPILTERSYIGGLDPDGFLEHSSICLIHQSLEDWPIAGWSDDRLTEYCRRYNIRWIVAWSPTVIQRFEDWKLAEKRTQVIDGETGWLFEVKRTPNFALKGQADLLAADGHHITLGNVVPHNGEVIISLHYHAGMRASPDRVQIEPAKTGDDPIGFVRLRLVVPAARVTLTWDR